MGWFTGVCVLKSEIEEAVPGASEVLPVPSTSKSLRNHVDSWPLMTTTPRPLAACPRTCQPHGDPCTALHHVCLTAVAWSLSKGYGLVPGHHTQGHEDPRYHFCIAASHANAAVGARTRSAPSISSVPAASAPSAPCAMMSSAAGVPVNLDSAVREVVSGRPSETRGRRLSMMDLLDGLTGSNHGFAQPVPTDPFQWAGFTCCTGLHQMMNSHNCISILTDCSGK